MQIEISGYAGEHMFLRDHSDYWGSPLRDVERNILSIQSEK
jgi:hypothetical protein